MNKTFPFIVLLFCIACTNSTKTGEKEGSLPEDLYLDYQVTAEEGSENVTIKLQYRTEDGDGPGIVLENPGRVSLDGETLQPDSTKFAGAYYELSKPVAGFAGKHTIVFIDKQKKEQVETFHFTPFTLARELPDYQKKQPFRIQLKDVTPGRSFIRLALTDTSHLSEDVNEQVEVENGIIEITALHLEKLVKGPVSIDIYSEVERPLETRAKTKGKLVISYGLKRQIFLR